MDKEKKPGFIQDFPPVSTQEWEEKIIADLKGADYEKKLVWKTIDGLKIKPYYRSEHIDTIAHTGILPGQAPYVRGKRSAGNNWTIRQDFPEEDITLANKRALKAIDKGVESVGLNAGAVNTPEDLGLLLSGIDPSETPVHFLQGRDYPALSGIITEKEGSSSWKGSFENDPMGYFLLYGKWPSKGDNSISGLAEMLNQVGKKLPGFRLITVNGQYYHNAGASIVQEVAFSLAQGNEYLALLGEEGIDAADTSATMQFNLAVGSSYFLEIAKLRAARMLWARISEQYKPDNPRAGVMNLHAVTSNWNKSVYDPYVNMLRTTTEAMAASIGGADSMTVEPFDSTFKKPEEFSYRIARNQQIILKHEAYFDKVADPAAGSYYVEQLTDSIAHAALKLFLEVEDNGGFIKSVESGFIRSYIEETCQKRDMDIAMRKQVFVGTNLYPNTEERIIDKIEPRAKLTDLSGLIQYRGPQAFEALRMAVEGHEKKGFETPRVFMFTYGNPAMRKARAAFSANFFGVAGYRIIDNLGFDDIEYGVRASIESGSEIVVLCSSDEEYAEMTGAVSAIKHASPKTQVIVAGNPKEIADKLMDAGADDFIHIRTNVLDALSSYNEKLGII